MTLWSQVRSWYEVTLAGAWARTVGAPVQTEGLEQLTATCEVEPADFPEGVPASGDALTVKRVDLAATTYETQFGGTINRRTTDSYPHRLVVVATGPLARLRLVREKADGDLNLTGMTDGAAVKAVLTYCGLSYAGSDVQDAGYVLGERAPVYWHVDQPGADIVGELDAVLGMKTLEIGDGRVIRLAYDLAPSLGWIQKSYVRGTNADFWRNRRDLGDRDRIANVWHVTGVSASCGDNCTCVPWAHAEADNPTLGYGVRAAGQTYQSDAIQDEALAKKVAERLMRWHNREPDELTIETRNDPDVHPGTVVGVTDPAYGIELDAATPYTVTLVDRRGETMTLTCVGGGAGDTGTITSGVEQRCNDLTIDIDWPGGFNFPPISFPPFSISLPWTAPAGFDLGFGPGGTGGEDAIAWLVDGAPQAGGAAGGALVPTDGWEVFGGAWTFAAPGAATEEAGAGIVYYLGEAIADVAGLPQRVRVSGTVEHDDGAGLGSLDVFVLDDALNGGGLWLAGLTITGAASLNDGCSVFGFNGGAESDSSATPDMGDGPIAFTLDLDPTAGTATATFAPEGGATTELSCPYAALSGSPPVLPWRLAFEGEGDGGAIRLTDVRVTIG